MTTINVRFLASCCNDVVGEEKAIDIKRAQRLARTGYVRLLDEVPEAAVVEASENSSRRKAPNRGTLHAERRG